MASAYSTLRNFGNYVDTFDEQMIMQGLRIKQEKYDANKAMIQAQVQELTNMDLAKAEDQDYLATRINTLRNEVNKQGNMDWSKSGLTENVTKYIGQALDENVMTAMVGTKMFRKEQADIEYIKKNKPKQYHERNHAYAMREYGNWVNDGKAGTAYKGSGYVNYVDVDAELQDAIKNADKYLTNVRKVTTPDGDFFIDQEEKFVSPTRLRQLLQSEMGGLDEQMKIDAYYSMGQTGGASAYKKQYNTKAQDASAKIAEYTATLNGLGETDPQRQALESEIAVLTSNLSAFNQRATSQIDDDTARFELYKNQKLDQYTAVYGGTISSSTTLRENSIPLRRETLNVRIAELEEKRRHNTEMERLKKDSNTATTAAVNAALDAAFLTPDVDDNDDNDDPSNKNKAKGIRESHNQTRAKSADVLQTFLNTEDGKKLGAMFGMSANDWNTKEKSEAALKKIAIAKSKGELNDAKITIPEEVNNSVREYFAVLEASTQKNRDITESLVQENDKFISQLYGDEGSEERKSYQVPQYGFVQNQNGQMELKFGEKASFGSVYGDGTDLDDPIQINGEQATHLGKPVTKRDIIQMTMMAERIHHYKGKSNLDVADATMNWVAKMTGGLSDYDAESSFENSRLGWNRLNRIGTHINEYIGATLGHPMMTAGIESINQYGNALETKSKERRAAIPKGSRKFQTFEKLSGKVGSNAFDQIMTQTNQNGQIRRGALADAPLFANPFEGRILQLASDIGGYDSELEDIEGGDFGPDGKGGKFAGKHFDEIRANYVDSQYGFEAQTNTVVINPEIKELKPYAQGFDNYLFSKDITPVKNTKYTVTFDNKENKFKLGFQYENKKGNDKNDVITLPPENVPAEFFERFTFNQDYKPVFDARKSKQVFSSNSTLIENSLEYSTGRNVPNITPETTRSKKDTRGMLISTVPPNDLPRVEKEYEPQLKVLIDGKYTLSTIPAQNNYYHVLQVDGVELLQMPVLDNENGQVSYFDEVQEGIHNNLAFHLPELLKVAMAQAQNDHARLNNNEVISGLEALLKKF